MMSLFKQIQNCLISESKHEIEITPERFNC